MNPDESRYWLRSKRSKRSRDEVRWACAVPGSPGLSYNPDWRMRRIQSDAERLGRTATAWGWAICGTQQTRLWIAQQARTMQEQWCWVLTRATVFSNFLTKNTEKINGLWSMSHPFGSMCALWAVVSVIHCTPQLHPHWITVYIYAVKTITAPLTPLINSLQISRWKPRRNPEIQKSRWNWVSALFISPLTFTCALPLSQPVTANLGHTSKEKREKNTRVRTP